MRIIEMKLMQPLKDLNNLLMQEIAVKNVLFDWFEACVGLSYSII